MANIHEQLDHGVFSNASHADCGPDAVSLNEARNDPHAAFGDQSVHTATILAPAGMSIKYLLDFVFDTTCPSKYRFPDD